MSWLSRILKGSELDRARLAAEDARERAEEALRELERWSAALRADERAARAAAQAHLDKARAAAAKDDLAGWLEAREQFDLARGASTAGRSALARAHPRGAALLLLADASDATAGIEDPEERPTMAAHVGEVQASCGDFDGARRTMERVDLWADRAAILRAIAIARATPEAIADFREELRALPDFDEVAWDHDDVVHAVVAELCRRSDVATAGALAETIEDGARKALALQSIATAEAHAGRLAEARAITARIEDPRARGTAWAEIAVTQAARGDVPDALRVAEELDGELGRWEAFGGIAAALADAGKDDEALALADRIEDPRARDDALTFIAVARLERRDFEGAHAALESIEDPRTRAQELVKLAAALQVAGERDQADAVLREGYESVGHSRGGGGSSFPAQLAGFLVFARAGMGELAAAEAVIEATQQERTRAELLAILTFHAIARAPDGIVALEDLLARYTGPLERIAILEHGARALLARESRTPSSRKT